MKIKKKEYKKQLDDYYWKGIEVGIRYALENPEIARRSVNNIQGLRNVTNKIYGFLEAFSDRIKNI